MAICASENTTVSGLQGKFSSSTGSLPSAVGLHSQRPCMRLPIILSVLSFKAFVRTGPVKSRAISNLEQLRRQRDAGFRRSPICLYGLSPPSTMLTRRDLGLCGPMKMPHGLLAHCMLLFIYCGTFLVT